ncbi:hypothetical protein FOC75_27820 (plasmid) [Bacillus cereus]|uniref:hypothetical protein n=1 Tax=Bacillus cereus group TaxID=86661 RepID=UPI0005393FA5|nr:hypothetical protein [Bacillus cereus]AJH60385.1 hypothetical protein BG11_5562 [Bacillus cereus]AJK37502.1 hypothetical protein BF33_5723 [Bacillus cereus]QKH69363.1 hypothetical protein FOC75_27820 [Bacillus cereus]QKH71460.1 hypothetical protein FOC74_00165 [Bacillus cereus]
MNMVLIEYGMVIQKTGIILTQIANTTNLDCRYNQLQKSLYECEENLKILKLLEPPSSIIEEHVCLINGVDEIRGTINYMINCIDNSRQTLDKKNFDIGLSMLKENEVVLLDATKSIINKLIYSL